MPAHQLQILCNRHITLNAVGTLQHIYIPAEAYDAVVNMHAMQAVSCGVCANTTRLLIWIQGNACSTLHVAGLSEAEL